VNLDALAQILKDVGKHYGTPLEPDSNHSCLIELQNHVKIQIEVDRSQQHLIIGCNLGELPPGKFREVFLREALRANGEQPLRCGTFAYSNRRNSLLLFEQQLLQYLEAEALIEFLKHFSDKSLLWIDAIRNGTPPMLQYSSQQGHKSSLFGL
jgi:hypothetical protein